MDGMNARRPINAKQSTETGGLHDEHPFYENPFGPAPKAPPKNRATRKRDAKGRFVPDDTSSRTERDREACQTETSKPELNTAQQTTAELLYKKARKPLDWKSFAVDTMCIFLWCSIIFLYGCILAGLTALAHGVMFDHYYRGDEPFWHWVVSVIAALLSLPFLAVAGLIQMDAQMTGAISNPSSPLGNVLRGGIEPNQQYQSSFNGRSQFGTAPGVQQSGIWQP